MKIDGVALGPLEMKFFAWAQLKRQIDVGTGDLVRAMQLTAKQEADLLYNLSSSGLILKLWRGYYLVPTRLPVGGKWSPSPYLMINMYMKKQGAIYQISGPVVFNSYGFSNQLASEFTIYNDRVSKKVKIQQYRFNFVKVEKDRLGDKKEFQPYGDGSEGKAVLSTLERALFDALYDYKLFGTLPAVYTWIQWAYKDKKINLKKLADIAVKYGNTMTLKRLGWLLEKLGAEDDICKRILKKIPKTKFLVPLNPTNYNGPINLRWGVIENAAVST